MASNRSSRLRQQNNSGNQVHNSHAPPVVLPSQAAAINASINASIAARLSAVNQPRKAATVVGGSRPSNNATTFAPLAPAKQQSDAVSVSGSVRSTFSYAAAAAASAAKPLTAKPKSQTQTRPQQPKPSAIAPHAHRQPNRTLPAASETIAQFPGRKAVSKPTQIVSLASLKASAQELTARTGIAPQQRQAAATTPTTSSTTAPAAPSGVISYALVASGKVKAPRPAEPTEAEKALKRIKELERENNKLAAEKANLQGEIEK